MESAVSARQRAAAKLQSAIDLTGLLHLLVVYVVWGSTYLAIRVAVREGAGFTPFTLGASRLLVAGVVLLGWGALQRNRLRPTRQELWVLAGSGLLLWVGGNGLVMWAEQRADSGFTALLVGSSPLWVALIESFLDRRPPSWLLAGSLLLGFAGQGLLMAPALMTGVRADAWTVVTALLATICWGVGSIVQRRRPIGLAAPVSSAYQQLLGGAGFVLLALLAHEPWPRPTPPAWWAWWYLLAFGSLLAFTSYVIALRLLPLSIVMTYAYVNPVIAVGLGWLILHESVTGWTIGGAALVLLGLAGVFRDRARQSSRAG